MVICENRTADETSEFNCGSHPCNNGGTCIITPYSYYCKCPEKYEGDRCEIVKDETSEFNCGSHPCKNGGTCIVRPYPYIYYCKCPEEYEGDSCEIVKDETSEFTCDASHPCDNGGTCYKQNPSQGYYCKCPEEYEGDRCELAKDETSEFNCVSHPCDNGGTCFREDHSQRFYCSCPEEFEGDRCETVKDKDKCVPNPCLHGGNCTYSSETKEYSCTCSQDFRGSTCNISYSCLKLKKAGHIKDGIYRIFYSPNEAFDVHCDMTEDSGGWTEIQLRRYGNIAFNRSWKEYKLGFGSLAGDYWLGLKYISALASTNVELCVEMITWSNETERAKYLFRVDDGYRGYFSSLTETNPDGLVMSYDKYEDGAEFSTFDRGNTKCASLHGGAGFWYVEEDETSFCTLANPNGQFGSSDSSCRKSFGAPKVRCYNTAYWVGQSSHLEPELHPLRYVQMKIREIEDITSTDDDYAEYYYGS